MWNVYRCETIFEPLNRRRCCGSQTRAPRQNTFNQSKTKNMNIINPQLDNVVLIGPDKVMDVRPIPCSIKHGLIIRTWLELPVGDYFILLNDHDPVPLYYQFSAEWPGAFEWKHLVKQPEEVRVKITKLKPVASTIPELLRP